MEGKKVTRVAGTRLRREGSKGSEGSEGSKGKVLKMDGPSAQGFLRYLRGRFLGLTGPMGRRVRKFDGPSGRGLWYRPAAMLIKSALRIYLSVSYVMKSITSIRHLRWLFPPLVPYGTKGGMHFQRPQGGCTVFAAPGSGISNSPLNQPALWAEPHER